MDLLFKVVISFFVAYYGMLHFKSHFEQDKESSCRENSRRLLRIYNDAYRVVQRILSGNEDEARQDEQRNEEPDEQVILALGYFFYFWGTFSLITCLLRLDG
jgi:hypothetical protein